MVTQSGSPPERIMRFYGTPWEREADFPFNFDLVNVAMDGVVQKAEIEDAINQWMFNMPKGSDQQCYSNLFEIRKI